jgi:hypothetical protein
MGVAVVGSRDRRLHRGWWVLWAFSVETLAGA